MDFDTFLSDMLAGLAAGAVLLYGGYRFVDRRFKLEERDERRREKEIQRQQNLEAVLSSVHQELESNAAQLTTALREVPNGGVMYPLFDLTFWPLISAPVIFTTLRRDTIDALTHTYNRMATVVEQNAFLSDLNHGPTSILAATSAAGAIDDPIVMQTYQRFQEHRDLVRQGVLERLNDLKPFLDAAIDAVEVELGLEVEQPASQRDYTSATPVGYIGDPDTLPPGPA